MLLKSRVDQEIFMAVIFGFLSLICLCFAEDPPQPIQREYFQAYSESPFSVFSKDYFARFCRDPDAASMHDEMGIGSDWKIVLACEADSLTRLMAGYLRDFLNERMQLSVTIVEVDAEVLKKSENAVVLIESGGGDPAVPESFTISAEPARILVQGEGVKGLRDGIVKLVGAIGLRQAPILKCGTQIYKPRIKIRVGNVPWMGSYRDLIFRGYNAVIVTGSMREDVFEAVSENIGSLHKLSVSEAIPELKRMQDPAVMSRLKRFAEGAHAHGLKAYIYLHLTPRLIGDDPVFKAHPEIRGALIDDGPPYDKYHLCTSHPLVRQYLSESVQGIMQEIPCIEGIVIIIGGEEFLHCFMRPYHVPEGRETNCRRCDQRGLETVLSDLCDYLGEAARKVNPNTEVLAWPYSAAHYWVGRKEDRAQLKFIAAMKPGTSLFTDVVKDDYIEKPGGIRKLMWDYSIDKPGPGDRVRRQIQACHSNRRKIYIHSEPELAFEISRLPYIPSMDKWALRAEGIASSGADGAFIWSFFRPDFGTTSGECFQYFWWEPSESVDEILEKLAKRIAGTEAGPCLREAWKYTSEAIDYSPVMDDYLSGPMYLGPAHPMCADLNAELSEDFYGVYKFPVKSGVFESDIKGRELFLDYYKKMEKSLFNAVEALNKAQKLVPTERRFTFEAEEISIRWFYHAARTAANLYESCLLRDKIQEYIKQDASLQVTIQQDYDRWVQILMDERQNAVEALPLMERDMRLDFYFGHNGAGESPHGQGVEMIKKKIELTTSELTEYLPSLKLRYR